MRNQTIKDIGNGLTLRTAIRQGDPYSYYDLLRAETPVYWEAELGGWLCTRYSDVLACLKDKRLSAERPMPSPANALERAQDARKCLYDALNLWMVFKEPPEHSRVRNVCNRSFSQTAVDGLRQQIRDVIDDLLNQWPSDDVVDLIAAFAYPLPARVLSPLLGVASTDIPFLEQRADDVVEAFATGNLSLEAAASYEAVIRHLGVVLDKGRSLPHQSLLRTMMEAHHAGTLGREELLANCVFLFLAARDTTTNLIGNGIYTLLRTPDQLELLRCDRLLIRSAIEEILRLESPVQYVSRIATEEMEIDGCRIGKEETVILSLGAANRDPEQFPDPHKVDIQRKNNHHLAFIAGVHYCLGTHLARLEGQLVLQALLERFSAIELVEPAVEWKPIPAIRALKRLRIRARR